MAFEDLTQTDQIDQLREAVLAQNDAMHIMLREIVELKGHTQEHHEVLNDLGRIVSTLEALLVGGESDEPTA